MPACYKNIFCIASHEQYKEIMNVKGGRIICGSSFTDCKSGVGVLNFKLPAISASQDTFIDVFLQLSIIRIGCTIRLVSGYITEREEQDDY